VDGPHVDHDAVVLEAVGLVARGDLGGDGVPVAAVGGVVGGARGEVVTIAYEAAWDGASPIAGELEALAELLAS